MTPIKQKCPACGAKMKPVLLNDRPGFQCQSVDCGAFVELDNA